MARRKSVNVPSPNEPASTSTHAGGSAPDTADPAEVCHQHAGECTTAADSGRAPDEWLRADRLPAFGQPPTTEDLNITLGDLEAEILRCVCAPYDERMPVAVNILHISPDISLVEDEIVSITDFMKTRGFTVRRQGWYYNWVDMDMLILGLNDIHMPVVDAALNILTYGTGLVRDWNVLLYGLDDRPQLEPYPFGDPLLTDRSFGFDAVCMMRAHMRMRGNLRFWAGHFASMSDVIEYSITYLIKASHYAKPLNDKSELSHKTDILAKVFGEAKVRNQDVELFASAVHLMRVVRNVLVHLLAGVDKSKPQTDDITKYIRRLHELAKRYKRGDLLSLSWPDVCSVNDLVETVPFFVRLATIVDIWLRECIIQCAPLLDEPRDKP